MRMIQVEPPYFETGFYCTHDVSLLEFIGNFLRRGATLAGKFHVIPPDDETLEPYFNDPETEIKVARNGIVTGISSIKILKDFLKITGGHLSSAYMYDVTGASKPLAVENVCLGAIGYDYYGIDKSPLTIVTSADPIMKAPLDNANLGLKLAKDFVEIAELIDASYAAIAYYIPMPTLAEIKQFTYSMTFRDFYVSRKFLGQDAYEELLSSYKKVYIKESESGVYVSMSPWFNPEHLRFESRHTLDGANVWDLIARAAENRS